MEIKTAVDSSILRTSSISGRLEARLFAQPGAAQVTLTKIPFTRFKMSFLNFRSQAKISYEKIINVYLCKGVSLNGVFGFPVAQINKKMTKILCSLNC